MSKRLDVLKAVRQLAEFAAPNAKVVGLTGDEAAPARVQPGGLVVVRSGDPGAPEVDLSPLAYNYEHGVPLEITAPSEEVVDAVVSAIVAAVVADRQLGGLVDWLDAQAPETDDLTLEGLAGVTAGRPGARAILILTASYATPNPV